MSFANLKQSRGNFDKLTKELEKVTSPTTNQNSSSDDRFWKPELDKTGNGYAVSIKYTFFKYRNCWTNNSIS